MNAILKLSGGKFSDVVKAMCVGIREASKRENFVLNMNTYGKYEEGICYGCAATCAVQQLSRKYFYGPSIQLTTGRRDFSGWQEIPAYIFAEFETAVDLLRQGEIIKACLRLGISNETPKILMVRKERLPILLSNCVQSGTLAEYEAFADQLVASGL